MTIQCRTGCGEQITYEQYAFPDGFIYFLPLDLDETIHNCCNIPHNSEIDINENSMEWDESISDNYTKTQFELELGLIDDWGNNEWNLHELEKLPDEIKKNALSVLQMLCLLFPSPFKSMYGYNSETGEHYSDLNRLSDCYESLGKYKSAIRAREIQDRITDDQSKKIVELYKKSESFESELLKKNFKINISATEFSELIDKVENVIKSFIRKMYPDINELQKDFPELYSKANELKVKDSKEIKRDNDDVIEFLTIGESVRILKINKRNKKVWSPIEYFVINYAYKIVKVRNMMIAHYTDGKFETAVTDHKKAEIQIYAIELLEFFEKWGYR